MGNNAIIIGGSDSVVVDLPLVGDGSSGDPVTLPASATPTVDTLTATGEITALTFQPTSAYQAVDGTAGASAGPFTTITAITVKDGLVTALTGS